MTDFISDKLLKTWDFEDFQKLKEKIIEVFDSWYKDNLTIEHGKDKTTELTFGFPYSFPYSSDFALLGNTNCSAYIMVDNIKYYFHYIALTEDLDIVLIFADVEENYIYRKIGKIK